MSQVLIVEDDKDLLNLYRIALSKKGRDIATVVDGVSAIDMLEDPTYNPSVVFLDINLSRGISGLGIMQRIKNDPRLSQIPVVIVTADDGHRDYALRMGAREFMVKPIRIAEMAAVAAKLGA
jgi:two-component system alkaline phosphatase synthesis response regulator PhoP